MVATTALAEVIMLVFALDIPVERFVIIFFPASAILSPALLNADMNSSTLVFPRSFKALAISFTPEKLTPSRLMTILARRWKLVILDENEAWFIPDTFSEYSARLSPKDTNFEPKSSRSSFPPKILANHPASSGRVFAKVAINAPALAAASTASWSILSLTFSEKSTIAVPKDTNFSPKLARSSCSPNTVPIQLLSFGKLLANSAITLPAFAAASTASGSILPLTLSENATIQLPKTDNFAPNVARSICSPNTVPIQPLSLGRLLANSASIFPALAAAITAFSSTLPFTVFENAAIDLPNGTNCLEKVAKDDSPPVTNLVTESTKFPAVKSKIASVKYLTPCIDDSSINLAVAINGKAFSIKLDNSVPRLENDSPPDKNAVIPATRSAAVSKRTALANVLTPVITDSSTNFAPEINPDALFINSVKAVPISGRLEATPSINPPTIFPKNEPIAFPIFSKIGMPTLRNSSNFWDSVAKAPMAAINPPIATTRATKAATPNKAAGPANPAASSNMHAADKASTSVDNAMAIPIDCSGSRSLMLFRIALSPHITNPITTTAANAIGDMALAKLRISIAPTSAISNTERATAEPIACSGFISFNEYKMTPRAAMTKVITPAAINAIGDIVFAKLRIFIAPTSAISKIESANADPIACSGFKSCNIYKITPRAPVTNVITPSVTSIFSGLSLLNLFSNNIEADIEAISIDNAVAVPIA